MTHVGGAFPLCRDGACPVSRPCLRSAPRETRPAASLPELSAQHLCCCYQLIHRPGAESFQIESNELESQSFEHGGELLGHLGGQSPGEFFAGNLYLYECPL